uniref:60S ribosomal protein L13 n=1 Tax=Rhabditophanes sp. KR3021 TaxID=114890 RepID=A0AC35TLU0_9BILA
MAPKGNNVIPNAHFRKHWEKRIKTWFNQPGRKLRRKETRIAKAKAVAPRPAAGLLKPVVRCPTHKYNNKLRLGRGFTLEELKAAGISRGQASTIGVAVDYRRVNKSAPGLQLNIERLKLYKSKLIVFPKKSSAPKKGDATAEEVKLAQQLVGRVLPLTKPTISVPLAKVTEELKKFEVFKHLRRVRADARYKGKREKKAAEAAEDGLGGGRR